MGELEEKETPPAETTNHQQEVVEEPKETDKMLEKKENNESAAATESTSAGATTKEKNLSPSAEKKKPSTPVGGEKKSSASASSLNAATSIDDETKKVNGGEEIIDIPEGGNAETNDAKNIDNDDDENDEKKISKEEREVKPKKIPIGGLKLPGFFMKSKPRAEGDGADGELLEKENKADAATAEGGGGKTPKKDEKPRVNFGERLRNFFVRKTAAEKQKQAAAANVAASGGDADNKSEATTEASPAEGVEEVPAAAAADAPPPQKRGLLNAIKLPIGNIIPKKKMANDVELGLGKAGLASMETLDDSLKDQDCVDKVANNNNSKNNGTDDVSKLKKTPSGGELIKQAAADEKPQSPESEQQTLRDRIRNYRCSVDDILIALGILLFILLLGVIGYALSHETLTSTPVREGRFMDAVTSCGMIEGLKEDGVFAFRGIPYALPPVGDNRWKSAQLIEGIDDCWNGTYRAHNDSALCTQMLGNGTIVGDEDCLYLDVFTPHVRYDNPMPVVVLIGAESLNGPSPGALLPSAFQAHAHNVVFVRPNFRLGAFGFLALDALTKDAYPHTSGNYALSDIIAALNWINLNIAHFGGNTESVTLLGHHAGATLVSALVTSKKIKNLYTRAWVSSSSAIFPGKPLHESEKRNQELMNALDCQDVACLRSASMEQIWTATPDTWLHFPVDIPTVEESTSSSHHEWLVLDGAVLQQHPADSWKQETGNGEKHKLVMGAAAHESHTAKLRSRYTNWTAEEVRTFIENSKIGALNLTDAAIERYNATNYRALVAMISDIRTICPLLTNARLQPMVPFYVVTQGAGVDQLATLNSDVLAILGRYESENAEQRRFVATMQNLFYNYVTHGIVPQYDPRRRVLNVAQEPLPQEDHPNCNFWISNDIVPRYARID